MCHCHAKEVARVCNNTRSALHLHHVRTLTDYLAQTLAYSIVAIRLDYCKAMLLIYGARCTFDILQRAQNNLTRVVCQRGSRTDARDQTTSRVFQWLPIKRRMTYEMASLTFKTMSSSTPVHRERKSCSLDAVPHTWN